MRAGREVLDNTGRYLYTDDLLKFSQLVPVQVPTVPTELSVIATPLRRRIWEEELEGHPDREFVRLLLDGIGGGFRIGYDYYNYSCKGCSRNMVSAAQHPEQIQQYLTSEAAAGRIMGPVATGRVQAPGIQVSRLGVIPKPHQPGKWRLITDLSSPEGSSVNDGIAPHLCSVTYASVDDAVRSVCRLGRGALLAKFDLQSAYRLVPVHPVDRLLLGVKWKGEVYVDGALPFGLRSAPKLFTAVADALLWIMGSHGLVEGIHYLDDFLILGPPRAEVCGKHLQVCLQVCQKLGVAVAPHKTEGPSTDLCFLGIVIDTEKMELRLPEVKLRRLQSLIREWRGRRTCQKRQLLSLIGQLQHACRVVRVGRPFLRRLIDQSTTVNQMHHHIRINRAIKSDLLWWDTFLGVWNGVSMMSAVVRGSAATILTSDASGGWGGGAFTSSGEWFQVQWPESWATVHITVKELAPIVVAAAVWGREWKGRTVCCRCDNAAVVAILRSNSSKHPLAMHLLRCLSFFVAHYQLYLDAVHLPGRCNEAADALSRDNLPLFLQLVPTAKREPTAIPSDVLQALIHTTPEWWSPAWTTVLHSILHRD